jgi:cobalt-zinc-cadmium efflux system membrane fusion protein
MDLFVVCTAAFRLLYVLFVIRHARRQIAHFNVTEHPTAAWVELDNSDGVLRPGMFAEVSVLSSEHAAALVPKTAIVARRDRFYVYVESSGNTYERHEVTLGDEQGDDVVILGGIRAGERIVVDGAILLDAEADQVV